MDDEMETQKNERSWQRSWSQQSDRGSVGIRYLRPEPKSCSSTVPACLGRASPWQWLISQGWRELHSRDPVSLLLTMTLAWHLHSGHSLNKENIWINQNMLSRCPNTTMTLSQQFSQSFWVSSNLGWYKPYAFIFFYVFGCAGSSLLCAAFL